MIILLLFIRQRHSLYIKHGKSEYKTIFYQFLLCGQQIWPLNVKSKHNCLKKENNQQDNKTKEEFSKSAF
jgi:hypothetical protein